VVKVDGRLISPPVNEKNSFRVIHGEEVLVTLITFLGTDSIDLNAAKARGIFVTNTPGANYLSVVEHTMALMLAACAAALAVCAGIGAWQLGRREIAPDHVDVVLAAPEIIAMDAPVFSTMDDPHLHIDAGCPQMIENEVELQLQTALEFEKTPCPVCCANAEFEQPIA